MTTVSEAPLVVQPLKLPASKPPLVMPVPGEFTVTVTVAECVFVPSVPVTVTEYVPTPTVVPTVTVRVAEPPAVTLVGLTDAVGPAGLTDVLRLTAPAVPMAVVEIVLNDGTRLREENDTVRGTPGNPMTRDEIVEKARDLIVPVLGADKCSRLIETIYALEQVRDVRELRPLLQRG